MCQLQAEHKGRDWCTRGEAGPQRLPWLAGTRISGTRNAAQVLRLRYYSPLGYTSSHPHARVQAGALPRPEPIRAEPSPPPHGASCCSSGEALAPLYLLTLAPCITGHLSPQLPLEPLCSQGIPYSKLFSLPQLLCPHPSILILVKIYSSFIFLWQYWG